MIFLEEDFTATAVAEARAYCPTGEDGGIDNSCSSADGAASSAAVAAVSEAIASAPKTASPAGPRIWTPGQPTGDVTARVLASPPTVRSDDGKKIISTSVPDAHIYPFAGREWLSTIDAGAHLSAMQAEARGGMINTATGKKSALSRDDFEYITSAITDQATSAAKRGITPLFYSPEELDRQLDEFSALVPQVRGGRMKDGTLIEQEDAEHLFRVVQALTSPNASPFINMQRTDSLLQKFFDGDGRITTGDALGVTGPGIRKSLQRFQTIVDTLGRRTDGSIDTAAGLKAARELLLHRTLPTRDVAKFFADFASKSDKKDAWKPNSYIMDEMVPVFSTFGPKVGPFYENNQGNHDPLTADVWFTRTWGRVTGELVVPGKPEKAVEKAQDLMKAFKGASEEHYHGIDPRVLEESIRRTVGTGIVDDALRAWSADRLRHFAAGDYKEKKGVGGRLNRLAKNIVENDTSLMGDPGAGSRRSNMIKVMRAAASRTGMPVAYLQDVLWQDEQDAYAALGAKTATNVGQLSLYSDQIRRIAQDKENNRRPMARKDKRSYDPSQEEFYDDYDRGGREQMLWDTALADVSDQEFADAVIALAENTRRAITTSGRRLGRPEPRAFCPTGEDGGIDNSCSSVSASDPSLKERVPFKSVGDGKNSDFIRVPSVDELTEALTGSNSSKGTKIGAAKDIQAGTPVALRIDIPAFNYSTKNMGKAIYAVTIHENKGGKSFGSPLAYEPMARLTGPVTFAAKEKEATKVATGEANKFPLATVKGNFDPSRTMPPDIDSWTPVGYDPKKAAYFYDKKTGREVMGGTDAVSVGNSVFVRIPKYGYRNAKETYRDAGFWGIEYRAADCGRDEDGKFGSGNKCQGEGDGGTATTPTPPSPSTPTSTKMPTAKVGDPANGTAWLSPSGVFHPVPRATPPQFRPQAPRGFMTHDQWASLHGHEGGEDGLIKAGWTRVAQSGRTLYVQTGGKPLTHSQLKSLKDQAMTAGNDEVEHDLGGDKRRTIWSKNDRSFYDDAEARAFCATGEGNGVDNSCSSSDGGSSDTQSSSTATAASSPQGPASKLFSTNENATWFPASGKEPFPGASRYNEVSVSGGKAVASSLDSLGINPEDAVSLLGAPERSSVFLRPAPEFGQKFYAFSGTNTPPVFMGFESDVAGIRRGLEGTYVLGSRMNNDTGKRDLVLYGNVMDVLPAVSATAEGRHAAARAFYKAMVSSVENARKAGVSTVMFSAAGNSTDASRPGMFKGYTIWPRMGFDGPLPKHIVDKLPPDLSHARTLMDLHATREGTKWWAKNGEDIDVELNLADRNSPQNKVFDRFVKHFSRDRRDLPLGDGDGWLSPEDLARLDEMWAEIWDDEDILDDYDGGEQKFVVESRAFCATGAGGGIDNSCGSGEPGRILMAPDTGGGSGGGVGRWGGKTERWGRSSQTEIWTPDKPLFPGAERFASIKIHRPNDVKGQIEDGLKMTVADAILAAGPISQSVVDRTRITVPRLEVISSGSGIEMHWTTMGATTGEGYAEDEIQFREPRGTAVKAVEAGRDLWVTQSGPVLRMGGLFIHPDFRGKGIGLESVLHSTSSPVVRLEMEAERLDHPNPRTRMTGYRVWPKYGYDAPISVVRQNIQSGGFPQFLSKCKTISDVYATPGGPEWWAENGGPIPLVFDRSPRSRSWQTLLKYSDRTRGRRSMTNPEKIGCDSDTDESVDSFWTRVQSGEEKLSGKAVTQEEWDRWKEETKEFAKDGRPPEVRPH